MFHLSAFADEISPDLSEQIRVCREAGVTHFELRGVYGKNVLDFDAPLKAEVKAKLSEAGLGVICIGSPIGKVPIDSPWRGAEGHFARFKTAVDMAVYFNAPLIRVFSYYPSKTDGKPVSAHKAEVFRRFNEKLDYLRDYNVTLVHENEKDIFGEKGAECLELMRTLQHTKLRSAFDFANFVQAGEKPINNWKLLASYSDHIHIKDALLDGGKVVPAGQGDGDLLPILTDLAKSGYNGFLSLEPHLAAHGQFSGFSGPDLFMTAANALKDMCRKHHLPLAGL